jgi:hypothetical protein
VSLFGHFERVIGVFERSFRMPVAGISFAHFVMLGGRPVRSGRVFVLFGSLPMIFVHDVPRCFTLHGADQSFAITAYLCRHLRAANL